MGARQPRGGREPSGVFEIVRRDAVLTPQRSAILARRRPRHSDDSEFWGFHCARWRGDGRAARRTRVRDQSSAVHRPRPDAVATAGAGPARRSERRRGPVLDPIASLRIAVSLEPGESRQVAFVLGGRRESVGIDDLTELLAAVGEFAPAELVPDDTQSAAERTEMAAARHRTVRQAASGWSIHPAHRGPKRRLSSDDRAGLHAASTVASPNGSARPAARQEAVAIRQRLRRILGRRPRIRDSTASRTAEAAIGGRRCRGST